MKSSTFRIFFALAFGLLGTAVLFAQQQPAPSPAPATTTEKAAVTKATNSRPRKKRIRRAAARPQPKPDLQAAPAAEPVATPAPAPTPEPTTEAKPEAQPQASPEAEVPSDEKSPEVAEPPTPEARMREQLIVVEQMVTQGLKKEALAELRLLAAEDRFDPQGFYNVANAFARLDATDDAIKTYRKAIDQRKGKYSRASNNLGVVLLRQGFWDQAYEAFLQALRVENFHYAEASYNLGRLYAARGQMDLAVREWRRAVKVDPKHYEAARALGGVSSISRSTPEPTVAPQPISSPAASGRTEPASARTEAASARTSAAVPLTLNAESHELLQRARTDHERGRYEQAVDGFRRVIARNGGFFGPANLELSYSLIELRRNDEAIAELQKVAEKDGARFPISYYHLGRLYEQRGDLPAAELNYLRATQSYQTDNAQFFLNLSTVRDKRGDFAGALVAMENYVKRREQMGQRPDWVDARLKELREKAANVPKN
jgi:tetratricopeptide (TPR) repeat protein